VRAEALIEVFEDIVEEFEEQGTLTLLRNLVTSLENYIASPTEASQLEIAQNREALLSQIAESKFRAYPPVLNDVLTEIGVKAWVGDSLSGIIKASFEGNDLTPASSKERLQKILQNLDLLNKQANNFLTASYHFDIGADEQNFNDYEFSIVVPRGFVNDEFGKFGHEIGRLDKTFLVFAEIATGSRADFKIKSISSSDLTIILESVPATALLIATALERMAAFYETVLNIVVLQRQVFAAERIPEQVKEGMEKHVEDEKALGLEKIATAIEKEFFKNVDSGRKNELGIELRKSLQQLALRFDSGFMFDVRGGEPDDSHVDEEGALDNSQEAIIRYQRIKNARETIRHFQAQSEPLLRLTQAGNDNMDDEEAS
jgi:hypothetical protein